jgi:hypothetical protein
VLTAAVLLAFLSSLDAQAMASPNTVEVTLHQSQFDIAVGDRITIRSTLINQGAAPTNRLIAHIHVANLEGVYVDLEEWTANPIVQLESLAPGGSAEASWDVQAPKAGAFNVYAVVLHRSGGSSPRSMVESPPVNPLVVSSPVGVTVQGRRTLTAGGALPVVLAVPFLLGAFAAAVRRRARRTN